MRNPRLTTFCIASALVVGIAVGGYFELLHGLRHSAETILQVGRDVIRPIKASTAQVAISSEAAKPDVPWYGPRKRYPAGSESTKYGSRLADTWMNGIEAGYVLLDDIRSEEFHGSTLDMPTVPPGSLDDGWHNPFCFIKSGHTIMLVSGGGDSTPIECKALRIEIPSDVPERKMFETADGRLGLIIRGGAE